MITKLIIVLAIAVLVTVGLRLAVPRISSDSVATGVVTRDGISQLGDCPDTPNCQCSEASRESQRVARWPVTKGADLAIEQLAIAVRSMPGSRIVDESERYLHATFTTRMIGYIDDVEFLISDDDASVQIRSASRLGVSDLGANGKRIANLRQRIEGKL